MERNIAYIALFAALIAALGLLPPIALPIGVPITAQSLGVMLAGTILGSKRGGLAVLLFIGLTLMGLPLLSGGRGGLGLLASPTAGFVVGFPVAAFVTGLIVEKWRQGNLFLIASIAALIGGIFVLYVMGIIGFSINVNKGLWESTLIMAPFIPGDIAKAIVAGFITQAVAKARPGALLSRAD